MKLTEREWNEKVFELSKVLLANEEFIRLAYQATAKMNVSLYEAAGKLTSEMSTEVMNQLGYTKTEGGR